MGFGNSVNRRNTVIISFRIPAIRIFLSSSLYSDAFVSFAVAEAVIDIVLEGISCELTGM